MRLYKFQGESSREKSALRKLRKCIREKNKCGLRANILIVGYDNPDIKDHIRDAQTPENVVLTYQPNSRWVTGVGMLQVEVPRDVEQPYTIR